MELVESGSPVDLERSRTSPPMRSASSPSSAPKQSTTKPTVTSEEPDFTFDGLNPRQKTKPGGQPTHPRSRPSVGCSSSSSSRSLPPRPGPADTPGEIIYPTIPHPITKQPVSTKPANGAFLKHARWKADQAALAERRAKGIPDNVVPPEPWTVWRVFKTFVMALMLAAVLGKFITTSPVWGYEKQIAKVWREQVWKARPCSCPCGSSAAAAGLVGTASRQTDKDRMISPS